MPPMFGFSLPKLIFTILVIVVVIYGFRMISRMGSKSEDGGVAASGRAGVAEETQKCPVCGTYVAAQSPAPCDRTDCPYTA
ncbi:MAG TPA: hypothetical protein QF665_07280 [Alphaproteobacteria bacterium]|nr:hypothetical protein [Alphaproteobacteria bacterium]